MTMHSSPIIRRGDLLLGEYLIGKLTRTFKRSQFYDLIDNAFLYPQKESQFFFYDSFCK